MKSSNELVGLVAIVSYDKNRSLDVLPAPLWVFCRYSSLFTQSKEMHARLIITCVNLLTYVSTRMDWQSMVYHTTLPVSAGISSMGT